MTVTRPRPVYFQHLRKTAGTSLIDTLRLFFRAERVTDASEQFSDDASISDALTRLRNFDLVTGHSEILSSASSDAFKIAIFRNPFTRLLSERRQWMQAGDENIAASRAEVANATIALRNRPMIDILRSVFDYPVLAAGFWNHQAITLGAWPLLRTESALQRASAYKFNAMHEHFDSGAALRSWLIDNKARIAKQALQALRGLDYIGITENFDESVREIFARIELPEPDQIVVRNARSPFDDEGDPQLREIAAEFLELDNELYDAALERHAAFGRIARGSPADYICRELPKAEPLVESSREAPGGHGWYAAHQREDGSWSRWSGPGLASSFAASAPRGLYRMTIEIFGAASERSIREMQIEVEGRQVPAGITHLPTDVWAVTAVLDRPRNGRFDVVFRFPDLGLERGIELKQISFVPLAASLDSDQIGMEPFTSGAMLQMKEAAAPSAQTKLHYPFNKGTPGMQIGNAAGTKTSTERGREEFRDAVLKLKALKGMFPKEYIVAGHFVRAIHGIVWWLDLQDMDQWRSDEAIGDTADDLFAAFADVIAAFSDLAERNGLIERPWEAEARDHGGYALKYLDGITVPALLGPVTRAPDARDPGTPEFNKVLAEASLNLVEILERAVETLSKEARP